MKAELLFLGGAREIGANSSYLNLDGTGVIVDAGLHPKLRNKYTFPFYHLLDHKNTDYLAVTHAHTDHLGALPFAVKALPHVKVLTTRPTRDLSEIMLRDCAKLLRREINEEFTEESVEMYTPEVIEQINTMIQAYPYHEKIPLRGRYGSSTVELSFHDAGHILGSAGLLFEFGGRSLFHTGDVQFQNQSLIPSASFPRRHLDVLIIESTNAREDDMPEREQEIIRLTKFINEVTNAGGSVLLPCFALGKMQEVLKILYELMRAGKILTLPLYSGGMGRRISAVYDRYCYATPRLEPGFEVADIPQNVIDYENLLTDEYFKKPAIVVASSGMLNAGSTSHTLALKWMNQSKFGIGFVGYQDVDSPGYELLHSPRNHEFYLAGQKVKRRSRVEQFRFSAHATRDDLLGFVMDTTPNHVFIIHGEVESCDMLAYHISQRLPDTKITIPALGKSYSVEF